MACADRRLTHQSSPAILSESALRFQLFQQLLLVLMTHNATVDMIKTISKETKRGDAEERGQVMGAEISDLPPPWNSRFG